MDSPRPKRRRRVSVLKVHKGARYFGIQQVEFITGRTRQTIYVMSKNGEFPKPESLSLDGRKSWWKEEVVRAWARDLIRTLQERIDRDPDKMDRAFENPSDYAARTRKIVLLMKCTSQT